MMEQLQARDRAEARRRKLLMSAEDRLKRIVGTNKEPDIRSESVNHSVDHDETSLKFREPDETLFASNEVLETANKSEVHVHNWLPKGLLNAAFQPELLLEAEKESTVYASSQSKPTENTERLDSQNKKQLDKSSDSFRQLTIFIKTKVVISLLLGLIVRLCQTTVFGQMYIQTLCYPFIALEIVFIGCQQTFELDPGQATATSVWMTALRFAGMRAEVLSTYKTIMTTVSGVSDDFAIYFLTYMVAHIVSSVT